MGASRHHPVTPGKASVGVCLTPTPESPSVDACLTPTPVVAAAATRRRLSPWQHWKGVCLRVVLLSVPVCVYHLQWHQLVLIKALPVRPGDGGHHLPAWAIPAAPAGSRRGILALSWAGSERLFVSQRREGAWDAAVWG